MDKKCKNWFVRLFAKILNKYLKTLKICKSRRRSLVSKVKVFVKNAVHPLKKKDMFRDKREKWVQTYADVCH